MKKAQLLKFLEPFDDEIDIVISINDGNEPDEVDLEPVYKLASNGEGKVFLIVGEV